MTRTLRSCLAVAALTLIAGCSRSVVGARVGIDPVPAVHLFENHSSSLIAWRRAGVRDRILVHLDGHADLDWLPDSTVRRLAAASPDDLAALELHAYELDGKTLERFGIWNFVYPAARLGLVREYVWVVPDGTLRDPQAAQELVRTMILGKMQGISLDEARTLRLDGRAIRGTILGIKITVCELDDLPEFLEPVLLDIDLDYLTTRSATTQEVLFEPAVLPDALLARLGRRGVRTDLATISYSTMGGYLPPSCRWLGPALRAALRREPEAKPVAAAPVLEDAQLFEADALWLNERYADALPLYAAYRASRPQGPLLAYTLRREAGCLARTGHPDEAIAKLREVIALAPDHGDTRLDLGLLLRERGDLDGAIEQFLAARKILPELATYAMALGTTYAMQDRINEAVDAVEAAVSLRPTWVKAQVNLGVLLARAGRPVDAAEHLEAAAMLEPGDPEVMRLLERLKEWGQVSH